MNNKLIAIIVAVMVVACGSGIFIAMNQDGSKKAVFDETAFNTIGRMINDCSGIYIVADILDPDAAIPTNKDTGKLFFIEEDGYYKVSKDNRDAWGGLILGDPEVHSIQHAMVADIANATGLQLQEYKEGTEVSSDKLYYVTDLSNFDLIDKNESISGGIVWEPVYQKVLAASTGDRFAELTPTKKMVGWHTCSIIGANHEWLSEHADDAARFLAAYMYCTDKVNEILKEKGDAYGKLIDDLMGVIKGYTEEQLKAGLENSSYVYADDANGSLGALKDDLARFCDSLKESGLITSKNFKDSAKFADAFVDDSFSKKAAAGKYSKEDTITLRLPDVRDNPLLLPLLYGYMMDVFHKDYGITIEWVGGPIVAGDEVAKMLMNKEIDIGFFGVE